MKIYTKGGDGGETSLFDGTRVPKSHARVAAYGDVDELNACIGLARAHAADERLGDLDGVLESLQRDLFALGALLADPRQDAGAAPARTPQRHAPFGAERSERLEPIIDRWDAELPALTNFILPAGAPVAAALHVARTVARRAERAVVQVVADGAASSVAIVYLNRLSDLLFVAARVANRRLAVSEEVWRP